MRYAKKIGNQIINLSGDLTEYLDESKLNNAGYKEFIPATYEQGKSYEWSYEETDTQIIEHVKEIVPSPEELLKMAKESKISENKEIRDSVLFGGVIYKNVLFDSDTDQKVNLSKQVERMSNNDTITWYGMNGGSLLCTKLDLEAMGDLIYDLTVFVWSKDDYIKKQIEQAQTIEEVQEIVIDYSFVPELPIKEEVEGELQEDEPIEEEELIIDDIQKE